MIERLSDEEYFAIPAVSNSKLSRLSKCPAAMDIEFETTPAMLLGTLAHCLILEGREAFYNRFAVSPDCDKRTNVGKAIWQKFSNENRGMKIITMDQLEAVIGMAKSVASHPACCDLLSGGDPEMAITWEESGEACKGKADWLSPTALIDLKSCQNSEYSLFSKTIINSGYYRQMGMYRAGLAANSVYPESFIIIAVESKPPYTVNVYSLDEDVLDYGEGEYKELLKQYIIVKDMPVKPSYTYGGIHTIQLPLWLKENV